ncbi:hypothetical protein [Brucella oryzae]|uniref:SIR2-like domain-containing protein n=1 Tax=Brucella oryzae TaxID=335286 RepID=A0A2S7J4G9_9HYPH|nr:hypothetical protein [Brucella oryzae]PQA75147.1 hypothetical protein C3731_02715 [Brucella oryzae]
MAHHSKEFTKILSAGVRPALLVGNGINRFNGDGASSWEELLGTLATRNGLKLSATDADEMSNTEFFDLLDLARPKDDRSSLQSEFCQLMSSWKPAEHHRTIVGWAQKHSKPLLTVNFDENLSASIGAKLYRAEQKFTDYYPWGSYFSGEQIRSPRHEFAIWHPHGMMKYSRSIRLGLTHYMGSVQRARTWVYGNEGLRASAKSGAQQWRGSNTWLDIFFFSPILMLGFRFGKDENFLRWLFLERARIHKLVPEWSARSWYIDVRNKGGTPSRRPFFEGLGITYLSVDDYRDIYESDGWVK